MTNIPYIIEVQICIALFWIVYRTFMRNSGAFTHNRIYLLGSVVFSFILPALSLPIWPASTAGTPAIEIGELGLWEIVNEDAGTTASVKFMILAKWICAIGIAIMTAGVSRHVIRIIRSIRRSKTQEVGNVRLIYDEKIHAPYSFFHYIFVNHQQESPADLPQIVAHEMAHVRLKHSYDAVFIQLMLILFWWNPFVWLWSRSLKEVHEYQADEAVIQQGFDPKHYINLLVGTLADIHPEFVSGFSYSLIKNRLLMMTKKTSRFAKLRILSAIPALLIAVLIFSCTQQTIESENNLPEPQAAEQPQTMLATEETTAPNAMTEIDEPFLMVEEMPLFKGNQGDVAFRQWILEGLEYPAIAAENGIQGRVILQFIVEPNGTLDNITILNSPDRSLSEAAIKRVSSSPRWTPGKQRGKPVRVRYTLPVDFSLNAKAFPSLPAIDVKKEKANVDFSGILVFIDGKKADKQTMDNLSPDEIQNISILKGKEAFQQYGKEAENGVILIETKKE